MLWRQLEGCNLPLSCHSFMSGDLYTLLNWVAFHLGNDFSLAWWWGQQIYLDQFCRWLVQYTRATTILFVQQLSSGLQQKKTSRQRFPVPLWGELTYGRGFLLNGQLCAKCFHGMTLSWEIVTYKNTSFISWLLVYCFQWRLWVVGLTAFVVTGGTVGCRNGNLRCHREDVVVGLLTILGLRGKCT